MMVHQVSFPGRSRLTAEFTAETLQNRPSKPRPGGEGVARAGAPGLALKGELLGKFLAKGALS
jgi:hypothetical protein